MRPEHVHETPLVPTPAERQAARLPARGGSRRRITALLAAFADLPPPRRAVVIGSELTGRVLGRRVLGAAPRTALVMLDALRLDGQLLDRVTREAPDDVYFDLASGVDETTLATVGARLLVHGVSVHFVVAHPGAPPVRAEVRPFGSQSLVSVHAVGDGVGRRIVRRALDVVGGVLLLALATPVLALTALAVWVRMGRPVFYTQERVGRFGQPFRLYKFRSMIAEVDGWLRSSPDAYARYVASNFKLPEEDDGRITPLGRFLRRTSLDELPQLWNVVRGDMSLVGPRAVVPEEVAEYGDYARMLLRVKPGLTGLWQVSGRSSIGYPERARIDLGYVQRDSLLEDLAILLRTLPAVIRQRGAL